MKRYLFGRLAGLLLIQAVLLGMVSCKDDLTIGEDPYAGGRSHLVFRSLKIIPTQKLRNRGLWLPSL